MITTLLAPSDERWLSALSRCRHDFYHLPAYVDLMAKHEGGAGCAFLAEEGDGFFFLPLIVRPVTVVGASVQECPEERDAISPYGYACPLVRLPSCDSERRRFLDAAIAALKREMAERWVCSAFVRLHPLFGGTRRDLARHGIVAQQGETVFLDLGLSDVELWRQTRKGHKSEINKLKRQGLVAEMDTSFRWYEDFIRMYRDTMERVGADTYYYFDPTYFSGLREALGRQLHLCVVRNETGLAAAALITESCGIVQYHLSASVPSCSHPPATKLIIDFVRCWAKERGNRVLHLGGGRGSNSDSLFSFKAGFSELRARFATWRLIFDEEMYARACRAWEDAAGVKADDMCGFFPAYRKPIPDEQS